MQRICLLKDLSLLKVTDVLVTHHHPDHAEYAKHLRGQLGAEIQVWILPWADAIGDSCYHPLRRQSIATMFQSSRWLLGLTWTGPSSFRMTLESEN